ncbi:MAG: chromophore lyase CpcT/CpeT [Gammaproteobacteria bacterium]|nr:chromophore lyase CpcT/CpeT [Gammaproteobacteria bacterium]
MVMIGPGVPRRNGRPARAGVRVLAALGLAVLFLPMAACSPLAAPQGPGDLGAEATLALVRQWVSGRYDNAAQASRDLADERVPDDRKHRLMHQLFVPVTVPVPAIPGYLVFQQSSADGSEDPELITRVGLLQFFIDDGGRLHQRELNFRDLAAFRNAHRQPERLAAVTLADVRFDPGCDFPLATTVPGREVAGVMPKGTCRFFSPGLGRELMADDAVTIRPAEYWFLGRFVDETGRVMWGNAGDEPVKLQRLAPP